MRDFQHPLLDEVVFIDKTNSTMAIAEKKIRDQDCLGNFAVITAEQSRGKGRSTNIWHSPRGGLWLSLALYQLPERSTLTILVGIAIHQSLLLLYPELSGRVSIKWPNDIYIDDKKVAGILTTYLSHQKYHIIGIGINTNFTDLPDEIRYSATSLQLTLFQEVSNVELLKVLIDCLAKQLPDFIAHGLDPFLTYYSENSFLNNKSISIQTEFSTFSGICRGITKDGAILIELAPHMIQPFYAGSISMIHEAIE